MKKGTSGAVLIALLVTMLVGCSSKPSSSDGQAVLEKSLQGMAKVVSFKKTDGKAVELMGVKAYEISFEGEIECLTDVYVAVGLGGIRKADGIKVPGMDVVKKQGERIGVKGSISFEKTEKGWQGSLGQTSYYEPQGTSSGPKTGSPDSQQAKVTTESRLKSIYVTLLTYKQIEKKYPSTEQGLNVLRQKGFIPANGDKDGWGNPLIYRLLADDQYIVKSLGPDGKEGTPDDIGINQDGTLK